METELAARVIKLLSHAQEMIERGEYGATAWIKAAKDEILTELYFSEFKVIGTKWEHPKGYNFEQWVKANNAFFSQPESK